MRQLVRIKIADDNDLLQVLFFFIFILETLFADGFTVYTLLGSCSAQYCTKILPIAGINSRSCECACV